MFVVDASEEARARLEEARTVLTNLLGHERVSGKPTIVLGNKQDTEGALTEGELCDLLDLDALAFRTKTPCKLVSHSLLPVHTLSRSTIAFC